jgi:hypothetical protein
MTFKTKEVLIDAKHGMDSGALCNPNSMKGKDIKGWE